MKLIAISQRVSTENNHQERRDSLDQRWARFLLSAGCLALPVPNHAETTARFLAQTRPDGVLLTGGGDIGALGGTDPERDDAEQCLIDWARTESVPILGVCRGMQVIQNLFGASLVPIADHVATEHDISIAGGTRNVNSFHGFGALESVPELDVMARAADGVIEAVRHTHEPCLGIMWHPERRAEAAAEDLQIFADFFGGQKN